MAENQSVEWLDAAAKSLLPDGTPVPAPVSEMIHDFLASAAKGPLKGTELDAATVRLFQAWSAKKTEGENAAE